MDLSQAQSWAHHLATELGNLVARIPGSSVVLRYIKYSYQDDPIRSVIELLLCLFAIRYLLAPSYSTAKSEKGYVKLSEEVRILSIPSVDSDIR
jgi:serine palmitoyltransferase